MVFIVYTSPTGKCGAKKFWFRFFTVPNYKGKYYNIWLVPLTCYNLRDYDERRDLGFSSLKFDKQEEIPYYLATYEHLNCGGDGNHFKVFLNTECTQDIVKCGWTNKSQSVVLYNVVGFNG